MPANAASNEAQNFFIKHVTPSFDEWKTHSTDERLAMNLANNLNNLVEYYWLTHLPTNPSKVFNKTHLNDYRAELASKTSAIGLIRDIADAHKHLKLGRKGRDLTNANQTKSESTGYGQAYGMCYGGGELIVSTLDNGKDEYFSVVAETAYEYWKSELQ